MYCNNMQKKIEELCEDKQFISKLSMCNTSSEIAELFTSEGIPISADEMSQLLAMTVNRNQDELDENALDAISGGSAVIGRVGLILLPLLPKLPITLPVLPIRRYKV